MALTGRKLPMYDVPPVALEATHNQEENVLTKVNLSGTSKNMDEAQWTAKRVAELEESIAEIKSNLLPCPPQAWEEQQRQRELVDELWDEVIDYKKALQLIARMNPTERSGEVAKRWALEALRKYE